jgi:hypothetical protein
VRVRAIAIAIAVALTAMVLGALPARAVGLAGSRSQSPESTPVPTDPWAVPWSSVGPGWLLASWEPHPHAKQDVQYVELVSPSGTRYILFRLPGGESVRVSDWSGDGSRILLVRSTPTSSIVSTVDLQSGAVEASFTLHNEPSVLAAFTRPMGLAVLVDNTTGGITRYSLDGSVKVRFPARFPRIGRWTDTWLESPDGTQLVLGARQGIAIFENDGTLVAQLPVAHAQYCQPARWWSPTVILANCTQFERHRGEVTRLLRFSENLAQPEPLTRMPAGLDLGDLNAWRVSGEVYVQATTGCGLGFLAELHGATPTQIRIPGLEPDNTAIVAATSESLALESADGCTGAPVVDWYTPATDTVLRVLGPPVSPGDVTAVLGYPDATTDSEPN